MKFFESRRGNFYPISGIKRIIPSSEPKNVARRPRYARVYLQDSDEAVEIAEEDIEVIRHAGEKLLPAQEGFAVLGYYHSGDLNDLKPWVDRSPIIAWRMGPYGPEPVTLDTMYNDEHGVRHAILTPDGKVISPAMEADYESITHWEADMLNSAKEALAKKAALE